MCAATASGGGVPERFVDREDGRLDLSEWLLDHKGVHRFHETTATENLIVQNRTKELGLFYADREWKVDVMKPGPMAGSTA